MNLQHRTALTDIASSLGAFEIWGRLGFQEIKRRYSRTIIGPFWSTLSLGVFVTALGLVWAEIWGQDSKSYLPYLAAGMLSWVMISSIVSEGCAVFIRSEDLIRSFQFPYVTLCLALVWHHLIVFLHNCIFFVLVAIYAAIAPSQHLLFAVPALLVYFLNGIWVSMLLGISCARFRDISQIITSLISVAMLFTPILWSAESLPQRAMHYVEWNVLYHYVTILRDPLLGNEPKLLSWQIVLGCTVIGWIVTLAVYSRYRQRIPYWL